MKVAIVKYNAGNTVSVANALKRLGVEAIVTDSPDELRSAERIIFPGVGEASTAMRYLRDRQLDTLIPSLKQPVLGICLGMQLMCAYSDENNATCLNIFPHRVRRFESDELKVPHTGWNRIEDLKSPLFAGLSDGEYVYFVHGYYVETGEDSTALATYGKEFSAGANHKNFHAVQFHPEKSGDAGVRILANFLEI